MNNIFKSILLSIIILTFYSYNLFAQPDESIIKHVIDGNTIELDTGEKVQYIGVAVPDPAKPDERLGNESLEFNKNLVEGKKVRFEYDEKIKDKEHLLAYVYQDNVFVNAEIIKQGYGSVFIISPNIKYAMELIKLEGEARQAKLGIWSEQKVNTTETDNPANHDIPSLEKRISILEAKITELNSKLDQLIELVKTLQAKSNENQVVTQNPQQEKANVQSKTDEAKSDIVYISKTGTKYHKLNCRFLVGEPRQVKIEEAKRKKLEPCSICFPETRKKENDK